jgi:hypothetical protein
VKIIEPGRTLIKEGDLTKICRKDRQRRHFILFNNLLIYAVQLPTGKYGKERSFRLTSVFIKDIPDDGTHFIRSQRKKTERIKRKEREERKKERK